MKIYKLSKTTKDDLDGNLSSVIDDVKNYTSPEDFEKAYTQEHLMDLSNREKHRIGRIFDASDSVESILNGNQNGYLEDIRTSTPRTYSAIINSKNGYINVYRAVPPTTDQIINFLISEKNKILKYGNRVKYDYQEVIGLKDDSRTKSRYYDFLDSELKKINSGESDFSNIKDNSIKIGDYVTLDYNYAKTHGESVVMWQQKFPTYKIVSKKVSTRDVIWGQADFNEWTYSPQKIREEYPMGLKDIYKKHRIN